MNRDHAPWGLHPDLDWDDGNRAHLGRRISDSEFDQCFENDYYYMRHPKARSMPERYGDRYYVFGVTNAGRQLLLVMQDLGGGWARPITGWDKRWKEGS